MRIVNENSVAKKITDLTNKDVGLPIGNILVKKLNLPEREGDSYLISAIINNYKRLPVFKNKTLKNVTKEDLIVALKFEAWFDKVKRTATKPEIWNNRILYTTLRQIKIFDTSYGTFSTNNGRVLDTSLDGAVVVSHSDRDLLGRIDYH